MTRWHHQEIGDVISLQGGDAREMVEALEREIAYWDGRRARELAERVFSQPLDGRAISD